MAFCAFFSLITSFGTIGGEAGGEISRCSVLLTGRGCDEEELCEITEVFEGEGGWEEGDRGGSFLRVYLVGVNSAIFGARLTTVSTKKS